MKLIKKFAKIIELEDGQQVLVTKGVNGQKEFEISISIRAENWMVMEFGIEYEDEGRMNEDFEDEGLMERIVKDSVKSFLEILKS